MRKKLSLFVGAARDGCGAGHRARALAGATVPAPPSPPPDRRSVPRWGPPSPGITPTTLTVTGNEYVANKTTLTVTGKLVIAPGGCLGCIHSRDGHGGGQCARSSGQSSGRVRPNALGPVPPSTPTPPITGRRTSSLTALTMYLDADTVRGQRCRRNGGGPGATLSPYIDFAIKDNNLGRLDRAWLAGCVVRRLVEMSSVAMWSSPTTSVSPKPRTARPTRRDRHQHGRPVSSSASTTPPGAVRGFRRHRQRRQRAEHRQVRAPLSH